MPKRDLAIVRLARAQGGLVTADQLRTLTGRQNAPRTAVRSGLWQPVLPGVLGSAFKDIGPTDRAAGAMLWAPDALLSHYDAARLEGIWVPDTKLTWISVPFTSPRRAANGLRVTRSRHLPSEHRTNGLLRWTLPARTIVDLGQVLTRRQIEAALLSAIRLGKTTAVEVEEQAAVLPGRAGLADVRRATVLWTPERESLLEDVLDGCVRAEVTEEVTRQVTLHDGRGHPVARIDVAVRDLRIAFEADGLLYHSTDLQIAKDQARDRRLLRAGWMTVRFREDALREPAAVRREIAAIAARRRHDLRAA